MVSGGMYNRGTYVEIVGKGTSDDARSNARTLDWNGNEVLAGKLTVGANPTTNMDVATKKYVDNAIDENEIKPLIVNLSDNNSATVMVSDKSPSRIYGIYITDLPRIIGIVADGVNVDNGTYQLIFSSETETRFSNGNILITVTNTQVPSSAPEEIVGKYQCTISNITVENSDWNEDLDGDPAYVLNRPAIRAGDGENSVMIGQLEQSENAAIYHITFDFPTTATDTVTYTTEDDIIQPVSDILTKMYYVCNLQYTQTYNGNSSDINTYRAVLSIDTTNNVIQFNNDIIPIDRYTYSSVVGTLYYQYKKAIGPKTTSEGNKTFAAGENSHAEGINTKALGLNAHAEGSNSIASFSSSHAEGSGTIASSPASHAEGSGTVADGDSSHAEGYHTTASGYYSHAEGNKTFASGSGSHAEGRSVSTGMLSHSEGCPCVEAISLTGDAGSTSYTYTQNLEDYFVNYSGRKEIWSSNNLLSSSYEITNIDAENKTITLDKTLSSTTAISNKTYYIALITTASQQGSHAEGMSTISNGYATHAEGRATTASGSNTHAEGFLTTAKGINTHAEGSNTIASSNNQHVQGKYNIEDTAGTYADIVGNGTSDSARSNAYTLDWSGNGWYAGKLTVGTGPTENMDVATKQYVDAATAGVSPNLSGLSDTNIASPATGQILTYDGTTSKWVNTTSPYMTASQVNELITAALAQYGDGDTASYGFDDASEVSY